MQFKRLNTEAEIRDLIGWHNANSRYIVIDTETTGLNYHVDRITDIVLTGYERDSAVLFSADFIPLLQRIQIPVIAFNFKFDFNMLFRAGVDLRKCGLYSDPMLLDHLLDENEEHSLDAIVKRRYNDDYKERFWKDFKTFQDAPEERQLEYACKDVIYTEKAYKDITADLKRHGIPDSLIKHVHTLAIVLYNTELTGIRLDLSYLETVGKDLSEKISLHKAKMRSVVDIETTMLELDMYETELEKRKTIKGKLGVKKPEFNFDSSSQLCKLLYDKLNLPVRLSKTKSPTVDDAALESLEHLHPIIPVIREYRGYQKVYTAFIEGALEKMHGGRIYPSFNVNGTVTGRISSSNPNMQQLPKDGGVRGMYIPDDGYKLISADYCFSPDTEYLTGSGWKTADKLTTGDLVWQVNKDSLEGSFVKPTRVLWRDYSGQMITFSTNRGELSVTENHRMLWVGQQTARLKSTQEYRLVSLSQEGVPNTACSFAHFSNNSSASILPKREIWVAALLQAEGCLIKNKSLIDQYRLQLSIPRKVNMAIRLLGKPHKSNMIRKGQNFPVYEWVVSINSCLLNKKKWDLSQLGANQAKTLTRALEFWDGSYHRRKVVKTRRFSWYCTDIDNINEVQAFLVRSGYEAKFKEMKKYKPQHNTCYLLNIREKGTTRLIPNRYVSKYYYTGKVGCVTVPEGFVLVRQKGQTFVSGNCQLEVTVAAHYSRDTNLLKIVLDGYSQHDITAEGLQIPRATAKTINFALQYGAGATKIQKILGCSLKEAEETLEKYWNTYAGLRDFIKKCHKEIEEGKPLINPFGRQRHFPSKQEVIEANPGGWRNKQTGKWVNSWEPVWNGVLRQGPNSLIQGTGADLTSYSLYTIDKQLRDSGIGHTLFSVHDEVLAQVKTEHVEQAREIISTTMVNTGKLINLSVPLSTDCSEGMDRWSKS